MPSYLDDYPQQSNLPQRGTQDQMTPLQSRVATEVTPTQPVQLILSKVKNNDYIGKFGDAFRQAREEERQRRIKELEAKKPQQVKAQKVKNVLGDLAFWI